MSKDVDTAMRRLPNPRLVCSLVCCAASLFWITPGVGYVCHWGTMLTVVWCVGFSFRWSPLRFLVELSLAGPVGQLVKMFKSEILCGHKRQRCIGRSHASVLLFLLWWFITLFYSYGCQCGRLHSVCLWFGQHKYTYSISFSVVLAFFLIYFLHFFFTIALSLISLFVIYRLKKALHLHQFII